MLCQINYYHTIYSTAIRRHAYIPSDNLPNNRTEEHKPDVFDFVE